MQHLRTGYMPNPRKTAKKKRAGKAGAEPDFKALFYRKFTETHLFYEVGRIIASELEPRDLIEKVFATIKKEVPFEDASIYVVKKDLTGLDPFYCSGPLFTGASLETVYFENGAPGKIASTGEPLLIDEAALFDGFLHYPEEHRKIGSYIGISLKNDTRVLGVMGFSTSAPNSFRVQDFDLLRSLSHLISAGLEKAELFKKTLELSRVDELMGLYNYRVLLEKLDEEMRRKVRTNRDFSFIMIDIDNFKKINDRFGHMEGSRLLAQMGPVLEASCRTGSTDTCFRYGGEEFSILLAETDMAEAAEVAERVRTAIEEYPFSLKVAHPSVVVTVSLGVATMEAAGKKTAAALMQEADMALYRAKGLGKNRVICYDAELCVPPYTVEGSERRP